MHLMPSDAGEVATIVGIDPGTTSLGLCVLDFNVTSLQITSTFAQTFTERQLSVDPWLSEVHGNRYARIAAQKQNLSYLFTTMNPIAVVCESPFFSSRFPQAYGALVEIVNAIRQAVWEYDKKMDLGLLDPPRVKQAVGAAGNAGKEDVKKAVLAIPDLNYSGDIPLALLDEHSIDAIAVAHSKLCEFRSRSDLWNL